jgi:bifunctional DNA-binding transcriptional regulator/antitoxin component of YhaV-PrlF toxin-antitoxin module
MVYPPMTSTYQRVLSGRRVSLPGSLVKKFGIKEGDIVIVEEDRDSIRIMPAEIVRRKA